MNHRENIVRPIRIRRPPVTMCYRSVRRHLLTGSLDCCIVARYCPDAHAVRTKPDFTMPEDCAEPAQFTSGQHSGGHAL